MVILTPQAMTDPTTTAQELTPYASVPGKPMLASWMGGGPSSPARRSSTRLASRRSPIPTPPPRCSRSCGGRLQSRKRSTKPRLHRPAITPPQPPATRPPQSSRPRAGRAERSHRGRIKTDPRRIRHPNRRDPGGNDRKRRRRRSRVDRIPGRRQAEFLVDYPQDRRRRRAAQPQDRPGRSPRLSQPSSLPS